MIFVFYTIVAFLVVVLPPQINSSPTLQLYMRASGAAGAVLGHFVGTFAAAKLPKALQVVTAVLSVLLIVAAVGLIIGLMLVIEPNFTEQFPSWKPWRNTLLRNPLLLNVPTGAASGILLLSLVGLVVALNPPQQVKIPKFSSLDPIVKWSAISAVIAFVIAVLGLGIVVIPIGYVRLFLVVFAIAFLCLFFSNPDFFYRRLAGWLIVSWSTLNFSVMFAAEGTPWGNYLLLIGDRMDESFNYAVPIVAAILLLFDIVNRFMSRSKTGG